MEAEIADPANPLLAKEKEEDGVDPGDLIRGLVDVRGRLDVIRRDKEGRAKLVNAVLGRVDDSGTESDGEEESEDEETKKPKKKQKEESSDIRNIVEMDRRVGELEKLVGSSTTSLDEVSDNLNFLNRDETYLIAVLALACANSSAHLAPKLSVDAAHATTTPGLHFPPTQTPSFGP